MDLEKESNRESFESWFESRYDAYFMQFALYLDMYADKHTQTCWEAWQAAKAHEAKKLKGCVVVPVQCPDPDFAGSLFDELSKKSIGEFGDDLLIHFSDIDEEKIWALMVKAAKAQAAPEGYVLIERFKLLQILGSAVAINTNPKTKINSLESDFIIGELKAMLEAGANQ